MRELDGRSDAGIEVRLLWSEHDGRVIVTVADKRTGHRFAIEVRQGERALDVFHRPYAYAAWHGTGTASKSVQPIGL